MDRLVASEVSTLMLDIGEKLNDSVMMVMQRCQKEQFESYRRTVGELMGIILLDVMNPIYEVHPDLKPAELD